MSQDSEFKRIVRARMAVTGEKYTEALRAVLEAARAAVPQPSETTEEPADGRR